MASLKTFAQPNCSYGLWWILMTRCMLLFELYYHFCFHTQGHRIHQHCSQVVKATSFSDPLQIYKYGNPFEIFNQIVVDWYPTLVIHYCGIVTIQGYKYYLLNNMFCYRQHHSMHSVCHSQHPNFKTNKPSFSTHSPKWDKVLLGNWTCY